MFANKCGQHARGRDVLKDRSCDKVEVVHRVFSALLDPKSRSGGISKIESLSIVFTITTSLVPSFIPDLFAKRKLFKTQEIVDSCYFKTKLV